MCLSIRKSSGSPFVLLPSGPNETHMQVDRVVNYTSQDFGPHCYLIALWIVEALKKEYARARSLWQ